VSLTDTQDINVIEMIQKGPELKKAYITLKMKRSFNHGKKNCFINVIILNRMYFCLLPSSVFGIGLEKDVPFSFIK